MSIDIARRVHNHNFRLDPYVRSLLDTDFYKILMAYFIWKHFPDVGVTFTMKNRTKSVHLPDVISEEDLRAQLDYVKNLHFTEPELIWLQGNTFYGQKGIFPGEFIDALRGLKLPDYQLSVVKSGIGTEYLLEFTGSWFEVTLWEIYALSVVNEAKARAGMANMSAYQLRVLYANATAKLVRKLKNLRDADVPRIAEFGTRRRHGFLWQEFAIEAMAEELGNNFIGTSNALHAFRMGLPAIGTNAHELPMVVAALARLNDGSAESLFRSQYDVLELWQKTYEGNLLVALPDTFGTTQFLENAQEYFPDIHKWSGFREDSKDPYVGAEEKIAFWSSVGANPKEKLQLFSDGLDSDLMIELHRKFGGRIRDGYGWGTLATNDFRDCHPLGMNTLDPISVVCKVSRVTDMLTNKSIGAVKLSDNYEKATGPEHEISVYRNVFGTKGVANTPVIV